MKKGLLKYLVILAALVIPFVVNAEDVTQNTTLKGNVTDGLTVKSGSNVTIDLAGFDVSNASGKHTIVIEKGATAVITGNGTVSNNSNKKAPIYNDGTLTINNGFYTRKDSTGNSYYVILNHGEMIINGGEFSIANGISSLIDNGWYTPSENKTGAMASLTINNGTFNMNNNDKYIKNDDFGVMTVNGGEFNMLKPSSAIIANVGFASGKEKVVVNDGTFNYQSREDADAPGYAIWDYDWASKGYNDNSTTIVNGGKFYLTGTTVKGITNGTISDNQKEYPVIGSDEYVLVNEDELTQKAISEKLNENQVNDSEKSLINSIIQNKKLSIAGLYNIDLFSMFKNLKLEQLTESSKQINVTLKIPSDILNVKNGYKRTYFVVRVHDGEVTVLDAKNNGNGTVSFNSNQFSTYALAYKDEKITNNGNGTENGNVTKTSNTNIKNPQTYDSVLTYAILGVVSLAGIATILVVRKRFN